MPTCINLSEPKCHVRLGLLSHFVSRVPSTGGGVLVLALFEWAFSHISVAMYSSSYWFITRSLRERNSKRDEPKSPIALINFPLYNFNPVIHLSPHSLTIYTNN